MRWLALSLTADQWQRVMSLSLVQWFSTCLDLRHPSLDMRHPSITLGTWVAPHFKTQLIAVLNLLAQVLGIGAGEWLGREEPEPCSSVYILTPDLSHLETPFRGSCGTRRCPGTLVKNRWSSVVHPQLRYLLGVRLHGHCHLPAEVAPGKNLEVTWSGSTSFSSDALIALVLMSLHNFRCACSSHLAFATMGDWRVCQGFFHAAQELFENGPGWLTETIWMVGWNE